MSSETTTYNVYRVYFEQSRGPNHEGIALVPAQNPNQNAGRFYHVKGTVGLGMDYDPHPGYRFGEIEGFKESVLQFQFPRAMLGRFEEIAADQPPPYDPRALTEVNPDPPVKNCSNWVSEVLGRVRDLIVE